MFLSIGLDRELIIWPCGDLLSSMLPGYTIDIKTRLLDLLHWNCSPKSRLITETYSISPFTCMGVPWLFLSKTTRCEEMESTSLVWPVHQFMGISDNTCL
ncbi:hypothetical protein ACHAW6_011125 [Cyclotella cf. meneghiniana]